MLRGRGRVVVFCAFFVFGLVSLLLFCFPLFFFLTRTSRLAPMARTLGGGLEHALFKFFVAAARLFLVFCVCPNFDDLAKQRQKAFPGVSEVRKNDFSVYFFRLCDFLLVFFFSDEQEPSGSGHCTRNTTHLACTLVKRN